MVAFESFLKEFTKSYQNKADDDLRAKKLAYAGALSHLANPNLMALEKQAAEMQLRKNNNLAKHSPNRPKHPTMPLHNHPHIRGIATTHYHRHWDLAAVGSL